MKLETIFAEWEQDCVINESNLAAESLNISKLHGKYHKIYTHERIVLNKYETELKTLRLEKYEFYTQGPTKETHARGWTLPPSGKILKNEVQTYIDCDKDIIEATLKIGIQHEKVELLTSIIKTISNRGFQIRNAVEWLKFSNGIS